VRLGRLAKSPRRLASLPGRGTLFTMADNVVNLNRFRKKKKREAKAKQAEVNRIRHGRTGAEKERERLERERAARLLEGKLLEPSAEGATTTPEPEDA
jgi:hypothetical protein